MVFVQLKKETGMDCYITQECKYYVESFFTKDSVTLPILEDEFCNHKEILDRLEPYNGPFADLVTDPTLHKGKLLQFYPPKDGVVANGYRPEDHISDVQEDFQKKYVKHLKETMTFRDNIMDKVQRRLRRLAGKIHDKDPKDVTYIGVHIRRTDHLKFMVNQFKMPPLTADYFNDAMEYFREEYDNCIFVVASDDIKWAKKNLDKSNKDLYFSDTNPSFHYTENGRFADDDLSKAAYDFALLTSCNHTIISRGTYTMWIALLTPGEYMTEYGTIVPPHMQG